MLRGSKMGEVRVGADLRLGGFVCTLSHCRQVWCWINAVAAYRNILSVIRV